MLKKSVLSRHDVPTFFSSSYRFSGLMCRSLIHFDLSSGNFFFLLEVCTKCVRWGCRLSNPFFLLCCSPGCQLEFKSCQLPSWQCDVGWDGKYCQHHSQGKVTAKFCEMFLQMEFPGVGLRSSEAPGALCVASCLQIVNLHIFRAQQLLIYTGRLYLRSLPRVPLLGHRSQSFVTSVVSPRLGA